MIVIFYDSKTCVMNVCMLYIHIAYSHVYTLYIYDIILYFELCTLCTLFNMTFVPPVFSKSWCAKLLYDVM